MNPAHSVRLSMNGPDAQFCLLQTVRVVLVVISASAVSLTVYMRTNNTILSNNQRKDLIAL